MDSFPFQLHPLKLFSLIEKESNWNRRNSGFIIPIPINETEASKIERESKQEMIRTGMLFWMTLAQPLSEAELEERNMLFNEGFIDWSRKEFLAFSKASEKYGRYHHHHHLFLIIGMNMPKLPLILDLKTPQRFNDMQKAFGPDILLTQVSIGLIFVELVKVAHSIEKGEEKLHKSRELYNQICCYVKYSSNSPDAGFPKSKFWSPSDDNYLVCRFLGSC